MSATAEQLIRLKKTISNAEDEIKEHRGAIKQLKRELKAKHGVSTSKEARTKIDKLIKEDEAVSQDIRKLESKIQKLLEDV